MTNPKDHNFQNNILYAVYHIIRTLQGKKIFTQIIHAYKFWGRKKDIYKYNNNNKTH